MLPCHIPEVWRRFSAPVRRRSVPREASDFSRASSCLLRLESLFTIGRMKTFTVLGVFLVSAISAGSCPSDYKEFHGGSNRLYRECYCKTVVPPEAVAIVEPLGMAVKSDTTWSEEVGGSKWYKCILVFSFKDTAMGKRPEYK